MNFKISKKNKDRIESSRREIKDILEGKDQRLLLIVGPCSAWPNNAVVQYGKLLSKINKEVDKKLKIVLRLYTQKPRTISGWNGPLAQPDPYQNPDFKKGIAYCHELMSALLNMDLALADEMLFLKPSLSLIGYLSWTVIGARSSEDQEHRNFASRFDIPFGIKNPTSGSIEKGIESVMAAQSSQLDTVFYSNARTRGNDYAHLVLRGGANGSNINENCIRGAIKLMLKNNIKNPSIIIDVSHDNCLVENKKSINKQIDNIDDAFVLLKKNYFQKYIKGFMLESFIKEGRQDVKKIKKMDLDMDGLSISDSCLSWSKTQELIYKIANFIK